MKYIARIQQPLQGQKLPYPYFIFEDGTVGRQDFWDGTPKKLLGFNKTPATGEISLPFDEFKKDIQKAISLYPVFENKNGNIQTHLNEVESIQV